MTPPYADAEQRYREEQQQRDTLRRVVREHELVVEQLTEDQFVEALRQALPDFMRHVNHRYGQMVTYTPYQDAEYWKQKYENLLEKTKP